MGESRRISVAVHLGVLALLVFGAQGCHYPPAVHTYEYLTDYERMSAAYDPLLSLVYVPQATTFRSCPGIIIGDIGIGDAWVDSPEEALGYATFFRVVLRNELLKLGRVGFVSLDKDEGDLKGHAREGTLLVEGRITKFDMGSGLLRYLSYFLWFVEAGATDFQIEGRITDAATGKLVLEFVDRRRHLCNTPFGPNLHNFDKGYAMNVTTTESARCIAGFIDMGFGELPGVSAEVPLDEEATIAAREKTP
jgi:hypothetical protein